MRESDWSYAVRDVEIFNARIGKFCNIAAAVRLNPTNHPMDRASLHHFTYRCRSHHLAEMDDPEVFASRRRPLPRNTADPTWWPRCRHDRRRIAASRSKRRFDRGRVTGRAGTAWNCVVRDQFWATLIQPRQSL